MPEDYVETLPAIDIDETGFTARGRAYGLAGTYIPAIDVADDMEDLPNGAGHENDAYHVHASWDDEPEADPRNFSIRINSGLGVFYYRALVHWSPL